VIIERPALERRVTTSLDAGRIPVVLGSCGTGRSSLLLRLEHYLGRDQSQYFNMAALATTPERCLSAVRTACRLRLAHRESTLSVSGGHGARPAFHALLALFDAVTTDAGPATLLLDEFLDVRTFESFPGLRHVQRELVQRLAESPTRFVLASRFTARVHRLLRDAPARFEVVHVPPLDAEEVQALALRFDGGRREWAAALAPAVTALCGGRAAAVNLLLSWLSSAGQASDPVAGLAALFSPEGQLTARYRESYELRLHRARGYGALKAILGVLAEAEPLNLTEIAQQLQRTPGSTKDYLSWLEDVDLVLVQSKRYSFEDPLLRLFVRLYGRPAPPSDDDIVQEVGAYARQRLPLMAPPEPTGVSADAGENSSGIIEID
jgi:hypothetical protein